MSSPQVVSQLIIMLELCVVSAGARCFFVGYKSGSSLLHDTKNDDIHTQKTATNATKNDIDCRLPEALYACISELREAVLPPPLKA